MKSAIVKILLLTTACIASAHQAVFAQSKAEVDSFFERMAQKLTSERLTHSNPVIELWSVAYDKSKTELSYFYRVNLSNRIGGGSINKDDILVTRVQLTSTACNSLGPFMRLHNLKVIHHYVDKADNKTIAFIPISKKDCN
jgi:hypothetical protein